MYLDFYGLREKPFSITPDPHFFFLANGYREALNSVLFGVETRAGFMVVIGEVGTGKTTLSRILLDKLKAQGVETALILNPTFSFEHLLYDIVKDLGIEVEGEGERYLLERLRDYLLEKAQQDIKVVIIIDDAQALREDTLEKLRLISNLETDKEKLLQIILLGQPELDDLLKSPQLRQLSQRISVKSYLRPLDANQIADYINTRLLLAGSRGNISFSKRALKIIYRYSRGIPRLINRICDYCLIVGYTMDREVITGKMAAKAARYLSSWQDHLTSLGLQEKRGIGYLPLFLLLLLSFIAGLLLGRSVCHFDLL